MTRHRHLVREKTTSEILPCCWMPCERPADGRIIVKIREHNADGSPYQVQYLFCSERDKQYFLNSIRDMDNLPTGSKGSFL